jgi:hypothetical protein
MCGEVGSANERRRVHGALVWEGSTEHGASIGHERVEVARAVECAQRQVHENPANDNKHARHHSVACRRCGRRHGGLVKLTEVGAAVSWPPQLGARTRSVAAAVCTFKDGKL